MGKPCNALHSHKTEFLAEVAHLIVIIAQKRVTDRTELRKTGNKKETNNTNFTKMN